MKLKFTKLLFLIAGIALGTFTANAATGVKKADKKLLITNRAAKAKLDMSSVKTKSVMFGFNKTSIEPDFYPELNRVVKLASDNSVAVKLGGNADNVGAYVYNWKLSEARANAVKQYLVSKGIDSARVAATGFGDTKPIASNRTKSGRLKNRRVDIQFAQ